MKMRLEARGRRWAREEQAREQHMELGQLGRVQEKERKTTEETQAKKLEKVQFIKDQRQQHSDLVIAKNTT